MSLIENRKALFNYEVIEEYEAGIELFGHEVKSIKTKRGSLVGAFVSIRGGEAFLVNADIPQYQAGNIDESYEQKRVRRLLLSKKEIRNLTERTAEKGLTLVPISMYNKGRNIKLSFALVRGKKKHDKRRTIREREDSIEIHRTLKKMR